MLSTYTIHFIHSTLTCCTSQCWAQYSPAQTCWGVYSTLTCCTSLCWAQYSPVQTCWGVHILWYRWSRPWVWRRTPSSPTVFTRISVLRIRTFFDPIRISFIETFESWCISFLLDKWLQTHTFCEYLKLLLKLLLLKLLNQFNLVNICLYMHSNKSW